MFFTDKEVFDLNTAKYANTTLFGKYFNLMLNRGIYLAPSQFETLFVSSVLSDQDIEDIIRANDDSLRDILES